MGSSLGREYRPEQSATTVRRPTETELLPTSQIAAPFTPPKNHASVEFDNEQIRYIGIDPRSPSMNVCRTPPARYAAFMDPRSPSVGIERKHPCKSTKVLCPCVPGRNSMGWKSLIFLHICFLNLIVTTNSTTWLDFSSRLLLCCSEHVYHYENLVAVYTQPMHQRYETSRCDVNSIQWCAMIVCMRMNSSLIYKMWWSLFLFRFLIDLRFDFQ